VTRRRLLVLIAIPLVVGWLAWQRVKPNREGPRVTRLQHPAQPPEYAALTSPLRDLPEVARLQAKREGIALYHTNCRPCHGATGGGDGPLARGLTLRPVDFTDPATIESVDESYAFWRIREGHASLPDIATPWNSAMPAWEDELTDDEIWRIVLAEYFLSGKESRAAADTRTVQWLEMRVPERPTNDAQSVAAGKAVYDTYCWTCHGERGEGNGPVAPYLLPRPRDFTIASYKLRTTESGQLPTHEDLYRTLTLGLPGTAMPAWKTTLTEDERWQVIAYIETFADGLFEDPAFDPYQAIVEIADPPVASLATPVAGGGELYESSGCGECHGKVGRGNGPKAPNLEDDQGIPIQAADLESGSQFRGGRSPRDVYLRLSTGLDGTPMPSYQASLSDEERWQLAYYVASLDLDPERERSRSAVIPARLVRGELPASPDADGWAAAREIWLPLTGQATLAPRWQTPATAELSVQALYNDREIALRLSWNDRTDDSLVADPARALAEGWTAEEPWTRLFPDGERTRGTFPDEVEVLVPTDLNEGLVLPHFVYGDAGRPVDVWRWSAAGGQTSSGRAAPTALTASGPAAGPPRPRDTGNVPFTAESSFDDGRWTVVFRRPLATGGEPADVWRPGGRIPIALHVRDGASGETGLRMALSSWYFLRLEEPVGAPAILLVLAAVLLSGLVEIAAVRLVRRRAGPRS